MGTADELFDLWLSKPAKKSTAKTEVKKSKRVFTAQKSEPKSAETKTGIGSLLDLLTDIQEPKQVAKHPSKKSEGDFMDAIRNIQKNAEKLGFSKEKGTFCKNKTLYILDSHRIVKSKYDFIGASENPEAHDVEGFFEEIETVKKTNAPSFSELTEMVKKARKDAGKRKPARVLYQFEDGLTVNADYLLDAMAITRNSEFGYSDKKSPLIFKSEDGLYEVAVLPVNPAEKFQGCKVA